MRKIIYNVILLQFLFLQIFTTVQATNLKLIMYNQTASQGTQVVVPVRVADFNAMLSIQGTIEFNPAIVSYYSIEQYGLPGMNAANFGTAQAGNGKITFSWFDGTMLGRTLADSSIIFAVRFDVTGNPGQSTNLNFTGSPTSLEFIDTTLSNIPYSLVNGSLTVSNYASGIATIMADDVTSAQGSQVIVPVRVKDFENILSIQGSINFSASVAEFVSVEQFNLTGMNLSNFGTSQAGSGIITFSWFDQSLAGQSVADSSIIFALRFNLIGNSGSQTSGDFTDSPTVLEFTDSSYVTFPVTTSSGSITISNSVASGLSFFPDSVFTPALTQVSVPIRTSGFSNVISIQGTIQFDTAIATYSSISQFGLSGMDINNFGTTQQAANGKITFSWLDGTLAGQTLADSSAIFTITFDVIGNPGEHTIISFSNIPTMLEFVDTTLNPVSAQLDSGGIYIELPYSISTDSISTDSICEGSMFSVNYTTPNLYNSGNIFTVQLSDSIGDFSFPVEIGNITNTVSGTINATIPFGTASGSAYRIRVVSSNPAITGTDNGQNITILQIPSKPETPTGQITLCENSPNSVYFTNSASNTISYTWQINPSEAGSISGTDTTATVNWNDSFSGNTFISVSGNNSICNGIYSDSLMVTINPLYHTTLSLSICEGDSYNFGSQILTSAGTYYDTILSSSGCDSILTLNLTANPLYLTPLYLSICEGESYSLGSQILTTTGTYYDTLTSYLGCDSIVELNLTVNPTYLIPLSLTICDGDSVFLSGSWQYSVGTFYDTLSTILGCDSIIETQLTVISIQYSAISAEICDGESYNFGSQLLTISGTYYDTLTGSYGCDSIITLNLTVNPTYLTPLSLSICAEDSAFINGEWQFSGGTFYDSLQTTLGCDSIIETQLSLISIQYSIISNAICDGESYLFGSQLLSSSGVYYDTLTSSSGCDSIVELNLTVNPKYFLPISISICNGDSVYLSGSWQFTGGIFQDTLFTTSGCDSIISTTLIVELTFSFDLYENICNGDSILIGGNYYNSSGNYTENFTSISGCDSIYITHLTVNPNYNITQAVYKCTGDSAFFGGAYQYVSGTYIDSLISISGCDSIIITNLEVSNAIINNVFVSICEGDSIYLQGSYQTIDGVYMDTLQAVFGCDSVVVSQLSAISIQYSVINAAICEGESYLFDSQMLSTSGTYYDTLSSNLGCDSIVEFQLFVISNQYSVIGDSICFGETYVFDSQLISNTGTYFDTLQSSLGCDSIITLNLTVNQEIIVNLGDDYWVATNIAGSITLNAGNLGMSYLWNDGSTNQTLVYNYSQWFMDSLVFYVTVSDGNCYVTDSISINFEVIPYVNLIIENPIISIYPNPATNEVFIETPNFQVPSLRGTKQSQNPNSIVNEESGYKLYSIEGKKVLEGKLNSPKTRISTKELESGVYFIEVETEISKVVSKLVINK